MKLNYFLNQIIGHFSYNIEPKSRYTRTKKFVDLFLELSKVSSWLLGMICKLP